MAHCGMENEVTDGMTTAGNKPIDFVIAWVDGNDAAWRAEMETHLRHMNAQEETWDAGTVRFRSWGSLRYWFRGVERYAPWVHKIYFVTSGHVPKWMDVGHPKLEIVKHSDYIPAEFLPTFNSHTIEWNLHRISGLSEQFVYFNDDMLVLSQVKPEDFFQNGKPRDMLALQPVVANEQNTVMPYIFLNNAMVLAKYFKKRENIKKQPGSYFHIGYPLLYFCYNLLELAFPRFTGFYTVHGPSPLLKETYRTLWEKEAALLSGVCSHKFRDQRDVSQYLLREWQKLSGCFVPANVKKDCPYFELENENSRLFSVIQKQAAKMICINDVKEDIAFTRVKEELTAVLEQVFPDPSSFERR